MELLETQNPERRKLLETSERHKRELEKEVKQVSERTEKVLKNSLIIGGTLAITYLVVSQLGSGKKKKKFTKVKFQAAPNAPNAEANDEEHEILGSFASITSQIANTATLMLLDIAKDALTEFLKTRNKDNENS
ncbi:MAG: hypothetical protein ACKOEV_11535 [Cytophagales bacterium]